MPYAGSQPGESARGAYQEGRPRRPLNIASQERHAAKATGKVTQDRRRVASPCQEAAGRCGNPAGTLPGRGAICVKIIDLNSLHWFDCKKLTFEAFRAET